MSIDRMISVKKNEWELTKNLIDFKEQTKIAILQKKIERVDINHLKDSNLPVDQKNEEEKNADFYNPKAILQKQNKAVVVNSRSGPLPEIVEEEKEAKNSEDSKGSINNSQRQNKSNTDSSSAEAGSDGKIKKDQSQPEDKNKSNMLYY